MNYYVPQSIACYPAKEMQGFRRGECTPYENHFLVSAATFKMPNIMLKRAAGGSTATVMIVALDDTDFVALTPVSQTIHVLDDPIGAYEMLVLDAGNWTSIVSPASNSYYLRIASGGNTWYTDAIFFEQTNEAWPQCGDGWCKLTWTDGRCISADTSTDGVTPVLAYPDISHSFFLYLQANLSNPEWEVEENGDKNASGVFTVENRRVSKRWKLEGFPVAEGVIDALQSSALFETVSIEFPSHSAFTSIRDVKVDVTWEAGGCFALFQYSFTTDYLLKQGCCT